MADTSHIKAVVEPHMRQWLSEYSGGIAFSERSVPLPNGTSYKFNAVSPDGRVVGAFLCNRARTRSRKENTGGVRKARNDLQYLKSLTGTTSQVMVFTESAFRDLN